MKTRRRGAYLLLAAALAIGDHESVGAAVAAKVLCIGSQGGLVVARTSKPGMILEGVSKTKLGRFRGVGTVDASLTAVLPGLPAGKVSVRVLPKGKAVLLTPKTSCVPELSATSPGSSPVPDLMFKTTLVSRVTGGERVVVSLGRGFLVVPDKAFKSAVIKLTRGAVSLKTGETPSLTGPIVLDTGGVVPKVPLTVEIDIAKLPPSTTLTAATVLFQPSAGGPTIVIPARQNGTVLRVDIRGSGTFEIIDAPAAAESATSATVDQPAGAPPASATARRGLLLYSDADGNLTLEQPDGTGKRPFVGAASKELGEIVDAGSASWSPTGTAFAYSLSKVIDATRRSAEGIFLINIDGGGRRFLVKGNDPSWTPDGLSIIYRTSAGPNPGLYTVEVLTGLIRIIPGTSRNDSSPRVSPDGRYIAFTRRMTGTGSQIFVMGIDGSAPRNISNSGTVNAFFPEWSPDSKTVSFVMETDGTGIGYNFVVNLDGSGTEELDRAYDGQTCSRWAMGGC